MESAYEKLKLEASKASRMHNTFRIFTEPIHWAAITGNLPAVRALLDSGVDADKAATSHLIFESGVCFNKRPDCSEIRRYEGSPGGGKGAS